MWLLCVPLLVVVLVLGPFLPAMAPMVHAFSLASPVTCTVTVAPAGLQAAINAAPTDGTAVICGTAGTVAMPVVSGNKDLVLAGPANYVGGVGTLTLTGGATWANTSAPYKGSRLTGVTYTPGAAGSFLFLSGLIGFRVDNNIMTRALPWAICLNPIGSLVAGTSVSPSEGLVDHNNFTNCRFVNDGEYSDTGGFVRWSELLNLGTVHNVYYEDNTSTQTDTPTNVGGGGIHNFTDDNIGGRYVARFNTLNNTYFEAHSIQGGNLRSQQLVEIYNNTLTLSTAYTFVRFGLFRGGTGIVFNNNYTGANWFPLQDKFQLDNVRSIEDRPVTDFAPWGYCNGSAQTVNPDGMLGPDNYPCRDQPGTAPPDAFFWSAHPNAPIPAESYVPWLFWGNKTNNGAVEIGWELGNAADPDLVTQIVDNRDAFQLFGASCVSGGSCTSGIGQGTVLPTTCSPVTNAFTGTVAGPYFWKTNEGSWNTKLPANTSGRMYKCTSTNTWTLYYTPFTYPHPLQGGGSGPTPPAAPTNLRIADLPEEVLVAWTGGY